MNWKVIKTEKEYKKASLRLMVIFNDEDNKSIKDELELLIVLIKDYVDKNYLKSL